MTENFKEYIKKLNSCSHFIIFFIYLRHESREIGSSQKGGARGSKIAEQESQAGTSAQTGVLGEYCAL